MHHVRSYPTCCMLRSGIYSSILVGKHDIFPDSARLELVPEKLHSNNFLLNFIIKIGSCSIIQLRLFSPLFLVTHIVVNCNTNGGNIIWRKRVRTSKTNGQGEKLDQIQPTNPDIHSLFLHWTRAVPTKTRTPEAPNARAPTPNKNIIKLRARNTKKNITPTTRAHTPQLFLGILGGRK